MPALEDTLRRLLSMTREAGTPAAAEARSLVADHLRALGYTVTLQPFTFHPSSLKAFPLFGAGLGGIALVLLPLLTFPSVPGWGALVVLVCGLAGLVTLTIGIGLGWIPLGGAPREDANLLAVRGSVPVTRWIVAHLDTKAQVQSMAGRLVAVWVVALGVAGLLALSAVRLGGTVPIELAGVGAAVAVVGGALAGRGRLHGHSPGARDNGTGVAAALAAAEASRDPRTAVLITGAEEFGMVGARMFAKSDGHRLAASVAINFDTIDDHGDLYLVSHDGRGEALAATATQQLTAAGFTPRTRRLPIGILVDSLPLARAGMPAVTIGRLTWRTLRLIHTTKDTSEGLSLTTATNVGRALATN
jgi:peptidase M28-like protein